MLEVPDRGLESYLDLDMVRKLAWIFPEDFKKISHPEPEISTS